MFDSMKTRIVLSSLIILLFIFLTKNTLCKHLLFSICNNKLINIKKTYPKVMSTTETVKEILSGKSISRFGDGELNLIMDKGLGEYQVYDKKLSKRLKEIIKSPTKNCIIAINNFCDKWDDTKLDGENFSYWEKYWLMHWGKLKNIYKKGYLYGCTEVSRVTVFKENDIKYIKKIWNKRKVLFVVGSGSHFVYEKRLFDNVENAKILVVRGKSSFNEYDSILDKIMTFDKQYLIMLSLGPCATVLAYDLSNKGYQALDIGHLPNSYLEAIGERTKPEKEIYKEKQFFMAEGIYDLSF